MSTYREEAVVLRKLDYGEADRIYTLLTKDHGKIGAIARGVRKTSSKLASALEVYSQVDIQLAHGRNLDVIAQVIRKPKPRIEAELGRTSRAALVAGLAARTPPPSAAGSGGFVCADCPPPAEPVVSPAAIKVLRVMFRRDVELYRRLKLSTAIMDEVDDVLADQLEDHLA